MFVFAHAGISLFVYHGTSLIRANGSPFENSARILAVAFFALLPDLVDKPLTLWIVPHPVSTRWVAHTLLFSLITCSLVYRFLPALRDWVWACPGHLVLDSMWESPHTLFFPFLGLKWDSGSEPPFSIFELLMGSLNRLLVDPEMAIWELTGLVVLIFAFARGVSTFLKRRWSLGHRTAPL